MNTLISAGALSYKQLTHFMHDGIEKVCIFSADPRAVNEVYWFTQKNKPVELLNLHISKEGGLKKLKLFNHDLISSEFSADGIKDIFQSLEEIQEIDVETVTLEKAIQKVSLKPSDENHLLINTLGSECHHLDALTFEQLILFKKIYICCDRDKLFSNSDTDEKLIEFLLNKGFYKKRFFIDYPCAVIEFEFNEKSYVTRIHIENQCLKAENEEIQRRQGMLVAELKKAELQVELIKEMLLDEEQYHRLDNVQNHAEQNDSEY